VSCVPLYLETVDGDFVTERCARATGERMQRCIRNYVDCKQVAIHDEEAQAALQQESSAAALLQEIRRRIREGSHRVSDALHRCYRLRDAGELEGARKLMEELLAVEVVPLYREEAKIVLEKLARLGPTPRSRKPPP